jgi:hypothetical protein
MKVASHEQALCLTLEIKDDILLVLFFSLALNFVQSPSSNSGLDNGLN